MSTHKDVCEGIFAIITAFSWSVFAVGGNLLLGVSTGVFELNVVEQLSVNDCHVVVFKIVLRYLAVILDSLVIHEVGAISLLGDDVAFIFFVADDGLYRRGIPSFFFLAGRRHLSFIEV